MANWVKIRGRSLSELEVLLQVLMLLPVVKLGLRLVGLKRMLLAMTRWTPLDRSPSDQDGASGARTVARIVAAAARCRPLSGDLPALVADSLVGLAPSGS